MKVSDHIGQLFVVNCLRSGSLRRISVRPSALRFRILRPANPQESASATITANVADKQATAQLSAR